MILDVVISKQCIYPIKFSLDGDNLDPQSGGQGAKQKNLKNVAYLDSMAWKVEIHPVQC